MIKTTIKRNVELLEQILETSFEDALVGNY